MTRVASYTLKGFIYQFNKTLLEILTSNTGSIITIEGIVEDIDIVTADVKTAIQCKYHEASENYTLSSIYKPLLQMMVHFNSNQKTEIQYILFAHFPDHDEGTTVVITHSDLNSIMNSKNNTLKKYIEEVKDSIDMRKFLSYFSLQFGPTFNDLIEQISIEFPKNGFPSEEIETLIYPNALNMIAHFSILHDEAERTISKEDFLNNLRNIRTTAISRWTLSLKSQKQLLDSRRKQLKTNLDKNSRLRYFVLVSSNIQDFMNEIVNFISDYLDKYHFKQAHINTPIFCLDATTEQIQEIQFRLFKKNITATDGYIGNQFSESFFYRNPLLRKNLDRSIKREFNLRILSWANNKNTLNQRKCDDLFIIGELDYSSINVVDTNIEILGTESFQELKYLMGLINVYN